MTESQAHAVTSQAVRDFLWAIDSPPLINTPQHQTADLPNPIDHKQLDADDLHDFLVDQTSHRVGYYFESLVHYWLVKIRQVTLVGKRIQIQDAVDVKRTVGEMDFLYKDETGALTHMETAVKFYLHCNEENPSGSHFIGPNAADNFERKTRRLFDHQLQVSKLAYPDIENRVAYVKGRIFYHPDTTSRDNVDLPPELAAGHLKNTWLRYSEIEWLQHNHADCVFRILRKPHWLANEYVSTADTSLLSYSQLQSQLQTHFAQSDHPNLISILRQPDTENDDRQSGDSECIEVDRVFVVYDNWPLTATKP